MYSITYITRLSHQEAIRDLGSEADFDGGPNRRAYPQGTNPRSSDRPGVGRRATAPWFVSPTPDNTPLRMKSPGLNAGHPDSADYDPKGSHYDRGDYGGRETAAGAEEKSGSQKNKESMVRTSRLRAVAAMIAAFVLAGGSASAQSWYGADTHNWQKEDWGGSTTVTRQQFNGRSCLRVVFSNSAPGYALIRTDYFPNELWEAPVTSLKAEFYVASPKTGLVVNLQPRNPSGQTIESLTSAVLPTNRWTTNVWTFTPSANYSNVSRLFMVLDRIPSGVCTVYVDNIRLGTTSGDRPWDHFDGTAIDWAITSEVGTRYDDAVDFNTNGLNDCVTIKEKSADSTGSLYLEWNQALNPNPFAKIFPRVDLNADWSTNRGISLKAKASTTNASIYVGFWDGSNYVATLPQTVARSNLWMEYSWNFPAGTFNWRNVKKVEPTLQTDKAPTGKVFLDEIRLLTSAGVELSLWSIGRKDLSAAEFQQNSRTNAYLVDYDCMTSFKTFPDRISKSNNTLTIEYKLMGADTNHDVKLLVVATPEPGQTGTTINVLSGTNAAGSIYLNPTSGVLSAALSIPKNMLVPGSNQLYTLQLVKVQTNNVIKFDYLDLSSVYAQTNLFDALIADAAQEVFTDYIWPVYNNWSPLQQIDYISNNMITNRGANFQPPHRTFLRENENSGWMGLQRSTGQNSVVPMDIFKYDLCNTYKMFVYDLDDWDWASAEARERVEHTNNPLDHTQIPEWSQYFAHVEIVDENPTGSASWPWNCAVRSMGYLKLTSAFASHSSSPRALFFNPFATNSAPNDEDQSRMPKAFFRALSETNFQVTAKTEGFRAVGALDLQYGNYFSTNLGYYGQATVRSKSYARKAFDPAGPDGRICLAGVASMFWRDEDDTTWDSRDQAHDNDMVIVQKTNGTFVSHELGQFPAEWATITNEPPSNTAEAPYVFNLGPVAPGDIVYILQQDRNPSNYVTSQGGQYQPDYCKRASFAYKILSANKRVVAKVYEGLTWRDIWDNEVIALEVDPTETAVQRGDLLQMDYELTTFVTPGVFLTAPNGGSLNKTQGAVQIAWEAHHPDEPAKRVSSIRLQYSANGLAWTDIATAETNDGSYTWNISGVPVGSYWLKIIGTADDGSIGWDVADAKVDIISSEVSPVHYVSLTGGNIAPYTNWAQAARTIQAAVDMAQDGDTVLVTNGVYASGGVPSGWHPLTNRVMIAKTIRLESVNGPGVTTIAGAGPSGDSAVRCVYMTSNATLVGFTLSGGRTKISSAWADDLKGAGAYVQAQGQLLQCILRDNMAQTRGGGAYLTGGNSSGAGVLANCLITSNRANLGGGVCADQFNGGLLQNCTIAGNTASGSGGGVCADTNMTVRNTIVYFNAAGAASNTYTWGSSLNFDHSCTAPNPGGSYNLTANPMFVNAAAGDYHLQQGSPCVDAGVPHGLWVFDLDRIVRPLDGDGNGTAAFDIGACELASYSADTDADGLSDGQEVYAAGTNPTRFDTDEDGLPDGFEVLYGFDALRGGVTNAAAWWKLDSISGTNVYDATTNANHGGTKNMATNAWVTGLSSNALKFDGSNDYVQLSDRTSLTPAQVSVSAWVKLGRTYSNGSFMIYSKQPSAGAGGYSLGYTNGRMNFLIGSSSTVYSLLYPYTGVSGAWYHVAGTYDGSVQRLYVNGAVVAQTNRSITIYHSTNRPRLGATTATTPTDYLNGTLDDVRVYPVGLSTGEVKAIWEIDADTDGDGLSNSTEYRLGTNPRSTDTDGDGMPDEWEVSRGLNPRVDDSQGDPDGDLLYNDEEYQAGTNPNLADTDSDGMGDGFEVLYGFDALRGGATNAAAWWKLDSVSGTNVYDATTNANVGGTKNMATNVWVTGLSSNALKFDGSNDYVQLSDRTSLKPARMSVSAWVKLGRTYSNGSFMIYSKQPSAGAGGYSLGYTNGRINFLIGSSSTVYSLLHPYTGVSGTWYHVAGTYDGSVQRLYVNGAVVAQTNRSITIYHSTATPRLGATTATTPRDYLNGTLDDVRIYPLGLAIGEVKAIWEMGSDPDFDGLSSIREYQRGTNPRSSDSDGDGLSDGFEVQFGLNPLSSDTEGDGMPDGWEVQYGLNPLANDAAGDLDGDGFSNLTEYQNGTNPTQPGSGLAIYVDDSNTNMENGTSAHPFNTITEGVNAASNGVTIYVADGWYTGRVNVAWKTNLTITGAGSNTYVEQPTDYKFFIDRSCNIVLKQFHLRNGQKGIYVGNSSNVVVRNNIVESIAQNNYSNGGAFFCEFCTALRIDSNYVSSCYGGQLGGAGYIINCDVDIVDNDFLNCTAWNSGGGFYFGCSQIRRVRLSRNYFDGNLSDASGAIDVGGSMVGDVQIDHNVIENSGADWFAGGAIKVGVGSATSAVQIVNNTIASTFRSTYQTGAAVYVSGGASIYAQNNILYSNMYSFYATTNNRATLQYNDTYLSALGCYNCTNGVGSLSANPLFVSPSTDNYTLQTNSPCINAGNPNPAFNDTNGSRNDMGAYGGP